MLLQVGTPVWMSPELLDQQAEYSHKVDLYSYAIVLNETLTCELPWRSLRPGRDQLVEAVLEKRERPEIPAETPDYLREIVEACWRHDPEARPVSARTHSASATHPRTYAAGSIPARGA